VLHNINMR